MDTPAFQLKRAEIQRRIQSRRLALETPSENHESGGILKKIFSFLSESGLLNVGRMIGQEPLVRSLAGTAASFLITRWARRTLNHS